MVVIVPGDHRRVVIDRHPTPGGMNTSSLPLIGREGPEVAEQFLPPLPEGIERFSRVVPEILPVLGPAVIGP